MIKRGNSASERKRALGFDASSAIILILDRQRTLTANEALSSCRERDLVRCEMKCSKAWWQSIRMLVAAISLAGLTFALGPAGWAQEQKPEVPSPAIRVSVRLVLADAVVTDKDGKVVTGLGPQNFTVFEDGKPQKVTMVSFEQPAELARALRGQRAIMPPNVTTNRPAYRMPSGAPVIVLLDALKMLQDFTDDPALLKAAVQSFNPSVSMELQIADVNQRLPRLSGALPDSGVRSPGRDPELFIQRMQEFYEEQTNVVTDARVGMTLTAFRGIAQAVAGLPGRKSLVWVSGAFPMATYSRVIQYSANPNNDPNRVRIENLYEDKLREADSILTDAQVAVYAVDARGLMGQLLGGAEDQGVSKAGTLVGGAEYAQSLQLASGALQETQATMKQVAGDTGGKFFINQNELDHSV